MSGLFEGHSYYFRVRAVNSHGISKASRMSDPIAALDPTEFGNLHGGLIISAYYMVGNLIFFVLWLFYQLFLFLHPFLSIAKKLGGRLEVVSFNDELDGELFFPENNHILVLGHSVCTEVCVFLQLKESLRQLLQESMHRKLTGHMWFWAGKLLLIPTRLPCGTT